MTPCDPSGTWTLDSQYLSIAGAYTQKKAIMEAHTQVVIITCFVLPTGTALNGKKSVLKWEVFFR